MALRLAHEILDRAPGVIAAVLDTAWRGTHRARLVARGIVVYTPQHDGIKPRPLNKYRYDHCIRDVYAEAGRPCERHISVDGQTIYAPLPVRELPSLRSEQPPLLPRSRNPLQERTAHRADPRL